MFAARTKALVKNLGARGDLIYNKNVNDKIQMLTLVKVRKKKFWPVIKYYITDQTLLDLLEEADVSPEFRKKEYLLQPLADLPESTSQDLRKHLRELLEDRDHLTLLEETWDQGSTGQSNCPQSVSSFMELLKTSNTSTSQKDAVHLLISALDTLPDDLPELLTSCSPETLRVLNQLVDRLKGDGQTKLPESLPQGEELRWVVELLCSTSQMLEELTDQWDRPEFPPGVMLEVLSLVVQGLSLMQPRTDS